MDPETSSVAPQFQPLSRPPQVSTSVAERILEQIVSGALPPGSRLPSEVVLARTFGVSRPSIREALAALQFAGHVESRRGYGSIVVEPAGSTDGFGRTKLETLDEAVDLLEARLIVEPAALAVAATNPDTRALDSAGELIGGMRVAVDEPELHATTDLRVHRALLAVCQNTVLRDSALDLVAMALDPMLSTARTQAWSSPDLPHRWADQHEVVLAALMAGDADGARRGSLLHLGSVVENLSAATVHEPHLDRRMQGLMFQVGISGTFESKEPRDDGAPAEEAGRGDVD